MHIGKICTEDAVCCDRTETVQGAALLMRKHHVGDVIVVDRVDGEARPAGIVTDRDILLKAFSGTGAHVELEVADVMSPFITVAKPEDDVFRMISIMAEEGISRLPVVDHAGLLCGLCRRLRDRPPGRLKLAPGAMWAEGWRAALTAAPAPPPSPAPHGCGCLAQWSA